MSHESSVESSNSFLMNFESEYWVLTYFKLKSQTHFFLVSIYDQFNIVYFANIAYIPNFISKITVIDNFLNNIASSLVTFLTLIEFFKVSKLSNII